MLIPDSYLFIRDIDRCTIEIHPSNLVNIMNDYSMLGYYRTYDNKTYKCILLNPASINELEPHIMFANEMFFIHRGKSYRCIEEYCDAAGVSEELKVLLLLKYS